MGKFSKKLVVVVNKNLNSGKAMNAVSHAMLGFGAGLVKEDEVQLNKYIDADGGIHDNISEMPIIVLGAESKRIQELRNLALKDEVMFVDFIDTMSLGTYEKEYEITKTKGGEELEYWAIVIFGKKDLINRWTRDLSLYS